MRRLLILVLLLTGNRNPAAAQVPAFQLMRSDAVKLLDDVARLYNKRVIAINTSLSTNVSALAEVAIDGSPVIKVPPDRDPTEADLVHELFHLKLIAEGFGFIRFSRPLPSAVETRLSQWVKDPIEHTIFFPQMKEMGFNPAEQIEKIASNTRAGLIAEPGQAPELSVVPLFALQMALRDSPAVFESFIKGRVNETDIAVSRQAVEIVSKDEPGTPDEEIATLVKVLNCLVPTIGTFSFTNWDLQKKGAVTVKTAIIQVEAPSDRPVCRR